MRHGNSQRRNNRKRSNGRGNGQSRGRVYDSNGPDVRIRGTAHQVTDKYLTLAKDAIASGNLVMAEGYFQHAEHYQRIINDFEVNAKAKSDAKQARTPKEDKGAKEDDLSLPASILGESADVKSEESMATA